MLAVTAWLYIRNVFQFHSLWEGLSCEYAVLVAESFTKKMAYSLESLVLLAVSIVSAWCVQYHMHESFAQVCFGLCLWKTIVGICLKVVEWAHMADHPRDRNCSAWSDGCAFFITDLPILVTIFWSQPMCEEYSKLSYLHWACCANGLISMVIPTYHMADSIIERGDRCTAAIYLIAVITAGAVFLRSLCIHSYFV